MYHAKQQQPIVPAIVTTPTYPANAIQTANTSNTAPTMPSIPSSLCQQPLLMQVLPPPMQAQQQDEIDHMAQAIITTATMEVDTTKILSWMYQNVTNRG